MTQPIVFAKEVEYQGVKIRAEIVIENLGNPKDWGITERVLMFRGGEVKVLKEWKFARGGFRLEELSFYRDREEELDSLLRRGVSEVEVILREERRERAIAELTRLVWSKPFGFLTLSEIPRDLIYDEDEVREKYINKYIMYGYKTDDMTPDGRYYVYRPRAFRSTGPVILIHKELIGKTLIGVKVEKTVKGTAWKILPGGDYVVLHVHSSYMGRGKWAPHVEGFFIDHVYVSESDGAIVLWHGHSMSNGGGLGETCLVIALPKTLEKPILIAKGLVPMESYLRRSEVRSWYLYSNGMAIDDPSILEP